MNNNNFDCVSNKYHSTELRILYWNPRSVCNKIEEIQQMIQAIDILVCVESWLKDDINFHFSGFNTFRKDRVHTSGGGIVFLIRKNLNYIENKNLNNDNLFAELCGIVITNLKDPITIIACYKPPDVKLSNDEWRSIVSNTDLKSKQRCILLGDFNSHNVAWNCVDTDTDGISLLEQTENFNLYLHNSNTYSRFNPATNCKSNIDLVFSTINIAHLLRVKVTNDSCGSDHFPIIVEFDTEKKIYNKTSFKIQSQRTNWGQVTTQLESDYAQVLNKEYDNLSPLEKYDYFIKTIKEAIIKHTPKKRKFNKKNHRNPVAWWDSECDKIKRLRQAAYKKWEFTNNISDLIEYKRIRAVAKKTFKLKKKECFHKFAESLNLNTNLKYTWITTKIFKNKWIKVNSSSRNEFLPNNDKIESTLSQLCPEWVPTDPDNLPVANENLFFDEPFSFTEFNTALNSRGNKSAPGMDGINYEVLHNLPIKYHLLLLDILNELYANNVYPECWIKTYIHFVEKPNGKGLRPLALTSCICKVFELMISYRIRWWVENNNILPKSQTGFRKGMSCADNLTTFKLDIENTLNNNQQVLAVFLDVSNAFNDVHSQILLEILANIGCSPKVLNFVKFLTHHRLIFSEINIDIPNHIYKGVPQGGVLSPLFYILYVYEIFNGLDPNIKNLQFADDVVLYIQSDDLEKSRLILENALVKVVEKLRFIGLDVSPAKTSFIHFNKEGILPGETEIDISDTTLHSTESVKFLGLYFDYQLSFERHLRYVHEKANRALNIVKFLRGTWWGAHPSTLITFYKSFVRSVIDYGSFIYFPVQKVRKDKLERIQFSAIRMALGLRMSTPTNVLLGESKLTMIQHRTKMLCENILLKVFSVKQSIVLETINKYVTNIIRDRKKKNNVLNECILRIVGIAHLIDSDDLPSLYWYPHTIMSTPMCTNFEIGRKLQRSNNPNELFRKLFESADSLKLYTDSSKSDAGLFVGSACLCPELNLILTRSIICKASIFTAECLAITDAMDIALDNNMRNINIFTDSLSVVLDLTYPKNKVNCNRYILEIRNKFCRFINNRTNNANITIFWIPAHVGITGNELADQHAKIATEQQPTFKCIPYTDFKTMFKKLTTKETIKIIKDQGLNKGIIYFQIYYSQSTKPWFLACPLSRDITVTICRCRSNHINLNESLAKIKVINDPSCECLCEVQDLNHVIWQCPIYEPHRKWLIEPLAKNKLFPPFDIKCFLSLPDLKVMQLVYKFMNKCNRKM